MTDAFTDELFALPNAIRVISPVSRLVLDVERLPDDSEPMAKVGMGMIYTKTADGRPLRRTLIPDGNGDLFPNITNLTTRRYMRR